MKINDFIDTLINISPDDLTTFYEIIDSFINNNINLLDLNNKISQIHTNLNNTIIAQIIAYDISNDIDFTF